ncbi:uncharacterized protein F4812DRAFT_457444 [Daldinia caldariorum]|uniref:uncharacterized protein n=1 Tax=Daldinia caldariorum TaxID=326644 RepID=UPI00200748CD|nr:uncharacterized protein F4812DRAFT_457444 [Daldinia caldariorum]KAI1470047.1 hypothetical protein F4812DRAFT_457444 [Daldinia caldariorum]
MSLNQCVVCWKGGGQLCGSCKSCHYCSKECQKSDWKSHKLLCKAIVTQPERPSPSHVRAIYFPQDKPVPELVWIRCFENPEIPEEPNHPYPDSVREILGASYDCQRGQYNYVHKKEVPRMIDILFRNMFRYDGSKPTESLYKTVAKHGDEKFGWKGPLLLFGISVEDPLEDSDMPVWRYTDATLADFRSMIDLSLGYNELYPLENHAALEDESSQEMSVQDVLANTLDATFSMIWSTLG